MYKSEIASTLKSKIDNEMNSLVQNTKMITLSSISNANSKEDLERIKTEIISQQEYVDSLILSLVVMFIMKIAVGIKYMLFRFGGLICGV
jgi:hypothetical protein